MADIEKDRIAKHLSEWLNSPPSRLPFPSILKQWEKHVEQEEEERLWKQWEADGWGKDRLDDYENHPYWAWKNEKHRSHDLMVSAGYAMMCSNHSK